jgi:hypothetical protein
MTSKLRTNGDKTIPHNEIKAKVGITDKKNHTAFYLEGCTFIKPLEEQDYEEVYETLKKECRRHLKAKLTDHATISHDFIMNIELCVDRMQKDKNSFLSFQYHFKQKGGANKSILDVKTENETFFIGLLNDLTDCLKAYNITASQKKS